MYRIVVLEQGADGDVNLLKLSEENWATAQHLMDALRRTVAERGGSVLYGAILDAPGASEGCCREHRAKVLI